MVAGIAAGAGNAYTTYIDPIGSFILKYKGWFQKEIIN